MAKKASKRILVTDDEPEMVEVFSQMLERMGYVTMKAHSGRECIDTARKENPDLLFLDIMMKPMDGWEVASIMKNDDGLRDIPIVMVTGKDLTLEDIMDRAYLIENYIMKSTVTTEVLRKAVEDVLIARTRSERILNMAGKSGVEQEMLSELKDRYTRKFSQYRNSKKLYNLYSQLRNNDHSGHNVMMMSSLKKGIDQLESDLAAMEKMLAPDAEHKGRKKKASAS